MSIEKLRDLVEAQGSHGTWNCNSYMHGMFNGMELMLAMLEDREPQFKDAPAVWLDSIPIDPTLPENQPIASGIPRSSRPRAKLPRGMGF